MITSSTLCSVASALHLKRLYIESGNSKVNICGILISPPPQSQGTLGAHAWLKMTPNHAAGFS